MARTQTAMLALLAIAAVALYSLNHAQPANQDFQIWKHKYNKQYSSHQDQYRLAVWLKNLEFVQAHQRRFQAGLQTYQVEMNHFADLTSEEFAASHLTNFPSPAKTTTSSLGNTNKCTGKAPSQVDLPDQIDWTKKGAVTAVKNQGQCGSCWAFSTTGSTEGAYFISGQQLTAFSEQQLVDCSHKYGNNGCLGGLMNYSFWYIKDHGITSESKYPYRGWKLPSCKYQESDKVWSISDCHQVAVGSEQALRAAVAQQPVSVAIQANQASFQLYKSGVFSDEKCGTKLDHGVLVVGYGVQNNKPYWKVKNSWADKWGEEGYIKILINGDGHGLCGIQLAPSFPIA